VLLSDVVFLLALAAVFVCRSILHYDDFKVPLILTDLDLMAARRSPDTSKPTSICLSMRLWMWTLVCYWVCCYSDRRAQGTEAGVHPAFFQLRHHGYQRAYQDGDVFSLSSFTRGIMAMSSCCCCHIVDLLLFGKCFHYSYGNVINHYSIFIHNKTTPTPFLDEAKVHWWVGHDCLTAHLQGLLLTAHLQGFLLTAHPQGLLLTADRNCGTTPLGAKDEERAHLLLFFFLFSHLFSQTDWEPLVSHIEWAFPSLKV